MKKIFVIFLTILCASNLFAKSVEEEVLEAANSMKRLTINKNGIPNKIIKQSQAIVIIPGEQKTV